MPSALVEALFLSNPTEGDLLLQDGLRQALARGYAGGIMTYFAGG
jgi:N-acetylmuramoyl-L-alanine amidase